MKELKEESRKRLKGIVEQRMKTMMIGSLAIIEELLLEDNDDIYLRNVYSNMRQRILDLGNNQIRNVSLEMDKYTIESNLYTYKINMKQEGQ